MLRRLLITGYKPHELGIFDNKHLGIGYIKKAIKKRLIAFIEEGAACEWVIISGQLGVELWAADVIFELKHEYPQLKLAIITPFLDQEKNWQEEKQEYYRGIVARADFVTSVTKKPYEGPWQFKAKNAFLLDNTDGMLVVYDEEKEGSPRYIVAEAKRRSEAEDYFFTTISALDLQAIVEEEQANDF
ncbi:hypothetical protein AM501_05680 [Aneurinibacillus migulanus]|uniref:UPF0398 protein AF333_01460 n=1 Tax=Aneurinibacillus migulanus TaxID=47500 RepID=A0A0D1XUJ5_ANEMI|nr:DUF1273 domain-containing protein [Aneurinibacillus migulanus]KIV50777.1 hypothetical protein TS64_26535 [Aneurinibacillus migulanus]KIV55379.1 hypothetical protein TS65_16535 [Aneurinibacillus migulanus]KON99408.1 hypothetical protein AF333_01460 [Aneurinibacillus migulanus]KPD09178.1 hypothetical protein AM501_05680 [Aneurinibacillus migulanus]MCP1358567.1 DUF1273 domain-containing protein [Aneurinibacillus migulanus]